jgi:hypothetical protein
VFPAAESGALAPMAALERFIEEAACRPERRQARVFAAFFRWAAPLFVLVIDAKLA